MKKISKNRSKKVSAKNKTISEAENRYLRRSDLPNKTLFFAKQHVSGPEGMTGPVYWELPGCDTKDAAEKLAEKFAYDADQDIALYGGWMDGDLKVSKNSKFSKQF